MLYRNILLLAVFFMLSGCGIFWSKDDRLSIDVYTESKTNQGNPLTLLVAQPVKSETFVKASYASLSQQALKDKIKVNIVKPDKLMTSFKLKVDQNPLAVYFVLLQTPNSRWKYYVENPQNKHLVFELDSKNNIKKGE